MTDTTPMRNQLAERRVQVAESDSGEPLTIGRLIDRQRAELARALPKHMAADRLARIATTVIKSTPKLLECSAPSLLGALMLSAQTGLEPGPLGHAYLVPRRNRGVWECQWMLGYKGIIELARRSGKLVSIEAREVCERDDFDFAYGLSERLHHRPYMTGERGPIVAFYGVAKFTDGGHYFLVMSKADVDRARERSDAARAGAGPWISDYAAMGRKTVIRRMAPFLPLRVEEATILTHDETVSTVVDPQPAAEPSEAGWVEAESWEPPDAPSAGVDVETGEVRDSGDADDREAPDSPENGSAGEVPSSPEPPTDAMTEPQKRRLFAQLRDLSMSGTPKRLKWASDFLGRDVRSFNELTNADAALLIDQAQREIAVLPDNEGPM